MLCRMNPDCTSNVDKVGRNRCDTRQFLESGMCAQGSVKRSTSAEMRMGKNTGKYVTFNRGPQGTVGITCERLGFCAKITGLTAGGPALNSGKLAVGDLIESVDDEYLASLSLDEIVQRLKGQPGSMITLHVHSEKAVAYLEAQKDMPKGTKEVGDRAGEGKVPLNGYERAVAYLRYSKVNPQMGWSGEVKVPLNEYERAVAYQKTQQAGSSCDIPPASCGMFSSMKSEESQDDTNLLHSSTCSAAGARLAAGSVSLPPAPSLSISSPPVQRFVKLPVSTFDKTSPSPMSP